MPNGTLILGAGFGGLTAAMELRRLAPSEPITVLDQIAEFSMGLTNLWVLDGRGHANQHTRRLDRLARKDIRFVRCAITEIEPKAKAVVTSAGRFEADRMIIALGADTAGPVPGLPAHAKNLYSASGAAGFHDDLAALRRGRALIWVHSLPFKCPPAPYEAAILTKHFLAQRGVEAEVILATPEPHPLPVFGPEVGEAVRTLVERQGVKLKNQAQFARFEGDHQVRFVDGSDITFDVLGYVPPHTPPSPLRALTGGAGWLEVDRFSLSTPFADVWAVGDATLLKLPNGKPIPKAGVLAEGEGLIVARNVAHRIRGEKETERFDGRGTCWIELGAGMAAEGQGEFFAEPGPRMKLGTPSKAALSAKEAFETERLRLWFDN
ncbi:MAG: NAD(P)/FAD-dependent oxidoreductase [Thermoplasmatota archaeon]